MVSPVPFVRAGVLASRSLSPAGFWSQQLNGQWEARLESRQAQILLEARKGVLSHHSKRAGSLLLWL